MHLGVRIRPHARVRESDHGTGALACCSNLDQGFRRWSTYNCGRKRSMPVVASVVDGPSSCVRGSGFGRSPRCWQWSVSGAGSDTASPFAAMGVPRPGPEMAQLHERRPPFADGVVLTFTTPSSTHER
jgi:hypothetical protein